MIAKLLESLFDVEENVEVLSARADNDNALENVSGFVYILSRGNAMLVSQTMKTYYIAIRHVAENGLATGDFVTARVDDSSVHEIVKIDHTGFDNLKGERPSQSRFIDKTQFKLGDRVTLTSNKPIDFVDYIAKHGSKIDDTYKIALLVDQSDDCVEFLQKAGINEVYPAGIKQNLKKKVLFALSSSLVAKRHATQGKDVILFIDNLNKLFKLYNSSMSDNAEAIDVTKLSHGALVDLKTFFLQAKQVAGGSLTIIAYLRKPTTDLEKYVMDDFIDLSNVVGVI
ncbi:MAG: hypothetical protein LBG88_02250 [Christensenellaceae bacterium]|jgi:transcription termination factor Rho|nr:hypothetical protein [Christensenellaceae bacterium]